MSWQLEALNVWLRFSEKPRLRRETSVERARARLEAVARRFPMPGDFRETTLRGARRQVAALRSNGRRGTLVWLHGGGYLMGSPRTHAALAKALARRAGLAVVLPDYRLAPEHPFPAAIEDALDAWRAVIAEASGPVVLGGDSAGGGLAFGLLHLILAEGLPLPAAVVAFSPWTDLTLSGESLRRLARREALLPPERLPEARDAYLAGADPRDPRVSPLFGAYGGAPPVLLQASRAEILLDDTLAIARKLDADGATVETEFWQRTPHVWQAFHGRLPEADAALDHAAAFLRRHLPG